MNVKAQVNSTVKPVERSSILAKAPRQAPLCLMLLCPGLLLAFA